MDGMVKADHFNFTSAIHNMFIVDTAVDAGCTKSIPVKLFEVIEKFSYSGQVILAAMTNGMLL